MQLSRSRRTAQRYAAVLAALAFLFFLRVAGQVLVAFAGVTFLPPMEEWQSGLLPYPLLLATQVLILAVQCKVSADLWRGTGYFVGRRPRAGVVLCRVSHTYFTVMLLRYLVTMWLYPDWRWFHGTIPIVFHWVLAAYLFTLGKYYRSAGEQASARVSDSGRVHDGT